MKVRLLVALISIALLGAAFYARSGPSVAPDFPTNEMIADQSEVVIDIPNGSSGSEIAQLLFDNGVVKSSEAFFRVAVGDKRSEKIAPGNHRISQNISAQQALEQLLDSDRITRRRPCRLSCRRYYYPCSLSWPSHRFCRPRNVSPR